MHSCINSDWPISHIIRDVILRGPIFVKLTHIWYLDQYLAGSCYNVNTIKLWVKEFCKIEVRHILFKKIVFFDFLK